MTYKQLKNKIKEEQKDRAVKIRILKAARKPKVFQSNPEFYRKLGYLGSHQYEYRHVHIMYCSFFNKTPYDKIERDCHESPNSFKLDKLRDEWEEEICDETVCAS